MHNADRCGPVGGYKVVDALKAAAGIVKEKNKKSWLAWKARCRPTSSITFCGRDRAPSSALRRQIELVLLLDGMWRLR